jgi:FkbM family methyltransferase
MKLKSLLRSLAPSKVSQQTDISREDWFRMIYQSDPTRAELEHLRKLSTIPRDGHGSSVLRALIQGFDHQQRATGFHIRFSIEDIEYANVQGNHVAIDRMDPSVGAPLKSGAFEPHLIQFFQTHLKPGMTFVDIGANMGTYSMLAAGLVGESGRVLSFEPNSENCRLILLGARRNEFQNIELFPFGLGSAKGHMLFATHVGSNGGVISNSQSALENPTCVVIPVFRLDEVLHDRFDCLKIDVEGAEGLVMQGAMRLIEAHRPIITSEFSLEMLRRVSGMSGEAYLRLFADRGYLVHLIDRETRALVPVPDVEAFVKTYGELGRIEDMAFLPQ